jgi:adenine-specific DNA-methyltransferase
VSSQIQERKKSESLEKLQSLLKTLFELDMPELDFGIYRIMNYRRKEVEEFIEKDLPQAVEKEFERYRAQSREELMEKIEKKKEEIKRLEAQLGEKILRNGDIEEKFRDKPLAREYLELKKQLDELEVTEGVKNQVFNDLYNFFSRYYEDGDFISKRRYSSRQHRYAVPYDGEEVKLYWANFDQYYVKTGEVFKDYQFKLNDWRIIFRTIIAEADVGNTKGERRYFVQHPEKPVEIDKESKICLIQFEYRRLTDEDFRHFRMKAKSGEGKETGIKQEELNSIIEKEILRQVSDDLKPILSAKENEKTVLGKHLCKYTRRITSDFFIHKNLKEFLERELDYFIKTEVIDFNNLEPRHIIRAEVVNGIGKRIIEFLSQIEDFQKKLWEKKKFVIKTDYVITTDLIPHEFHEEVLSNKEQLNEWKELGVGDIKEKDLAKKLPVDTKYFSTEFKERLLEKLSEKCNLDDLIDGIVIKSENFQALNLLAPKYRERIKCIYIDPPYNTGSDEFIYKDNYQHSCWLSMISDRLFLARELMQESGAIFINIDEHEQFHLRS